MILRMYSLFLTQIILYKIEYLNLGLISFLFLFIKNIPQDDMEYCFTFFLQFFFISFQYM